MQNMAKSGTRGHVSRPTRTAHVPILPERWMRLRQAENVAGRVESMQRNVMLAQEFNLQK